MANKRKSRWLAGLGILGCVIVLAVVLLSVGSSADAQMKKRLDAVAKKYGFLRDMGYSDTTAGLGRGVVVFYNPGVLSRKQTQDVVSMLTAGCPECKVGPPGSYAGGDTYEIELHEGFRRLKSINVWQHREIGHHMSIYQTQIVIEMDKDVSTLGRKWDWWPW